MQAIYSVLVQYFVHVLYPSRLPGRASFTNFVEQSEEGGKTYETTEIKAVMRHSSLCLLVLLVCSTISVALSWCSNGHQGPCHLKITASANPRLSRGVDFRGEDGKTTEARIVWSKGEFQLHVGAYSIDTDFIRLRSNGTASLARQTTVGTSGNVSIEAIDPAITFVSEQQQDKGEIDVA